MKLFRKTVGGDFELGDVPHGEEGKLALLTGGLQGTWTLSGRSALALALDRLKAQGVNHVHVPAYLCESILFAVRAAGFTYSLYPVAKDLSAHPDPPPGSAVLLIHYFGWLNAATEALRREAGSSFFLIEDASQALLSDWRASAATDRLIILSPRKFGPLPFGGWCNISAQIPEPTHEAEVLMWRSIAARLAKSMYLMQAQAPVDPSVEAFYLAAFRAVETYLDSHPAEAGVPHSILAMLSGLDWPAIGATRRMNWRCLHELLHSAIEPFMPGMTENTVPLGYVIRLSERDKVRKALAARRIFCPVHWPLPAEVTKGRFPDAVSVSETCLTLPIDQRYGPEDMAYMAQALKAEVAAVQGRAV